ncbi:MAG: hypothetical protein LBH94_04040, partial [Deltaproteobacteria bacterium]|nr:hypothetical protein [Deltaproteobacteria bacterium]
MAKFLHAVVGADWRTRRPLYLQMFFAALAFAAMTVASSIHVEDALRDHLRREAAAMLARSRAEIDAHLSESATVLTVVANTVREMILRGDDAVMVRKYLLNTADAFRRQEQEFKFHSLFGYFDVFGNKYMSTTDNWKPAADYDFTTRPWYAASLAAGDRMVLTRIYLNLNWNQHMVTYVRNIFDDQGKRLGMVCLHVPLDRIIGHVAALRLTKGGYGMFHDENLTLYHHPDRQSIGKSARELPGGIARLSGETVAGGDLIEREALNYQGAKTVSFSMRLNTGWVVYAVTPKDEYYQELYDMRFMLGLLGACLAAAMILILLRLNLKKEKADERTRLMLDAMPMGANFWDRAGNPLDCNLAVVKMFALPDKQWYIDNFFALSPECQPCGNRSEKLARERVQWAFEKGRIQFEWMHQLPDGTPVPCEITLVRVEYEDNFIVAGYTRDLREFKAMQKEMNRIEIAEASNAAKSKFLARMSHEIRTPLNAILGVAEIQMHDETLAHNAKEAFGRVYMAGYTLLGIINDILDLSRIEADKLELTPVRYHAASLINDIAHLNMLRIGSKPIRFALEVSEFMPAELFGDELRIKQVLNNLLSNAFKYTLEGVVTLAVSAVYGRKEEPGVTLVFRVSDTGVGMTEEQVGMLFDEYSRFNLEANREVEGAGLGMNIARHLIRLMNGEIFVESEPGKGSVFTVHLPQGKIDAGVLGGQAAESLRLFQAAGRPHMKAAQIVR